MLEIGEVKVKISLDCEEVNKALNEYKETIEHLKEENRLAKDEIERLEIDKKDMQNEIDCLMCKVKEYDETLEKANHLKQTTDEYDTIKCTDNFNLEVADGYSAKILIKRLDLNMKCDKFSVYYDMFKKKRIFTVIRDGVTVEFELNPNDEVIMEYC